MRRYKFVIDNTYSGKERRIELQALDIFEALEKARKMLDERERIKQLESSEPLEVQDEG